MSWENEWKKIKNKEPITFQNRLLSLMFDSPIEVRVKTTIELAKRLKETYFYNISKNGVKIPTLKESSINQMIKKHLEDGDVPSIPSSLNIEYLQAYAQYFGCSTDYLFGKTPYKTNSYDIRKICELTGLSEKVINIFVTEYSIRNKIPEKFKEILLSNETQSEFWINLLNNEEIFTRIPNEWNRMKTAINKINDLNSKIANVTAYINNDIVDKSELPKFREHDLNFINNSPDALTQNINTEEGFKEMLKKNIPVYKNNMDNYLDVYYGRMQNIQNIIANYLNDEKNKLLKN